MVEAPQLASGERAFPAPAAEGIIFEEKASRERTFKVIQGGMGAGVSGWELARAVAIAGEKLNKPVLGVVSGTGLPNIMIGRLRNGDLNTLRALFAFDREVGKINGKEIGKEIAKEYTSNRLKPPPKPEFLILKGVKEKTKEETVNLAIVSAFVEVWLAKQGHSGTIGINDLEKIQMMHLPTLLGAMLAGVDYVLVGAGIPVQIPKLLDDFAKGETASYKLSVEGLAEGWMMTLDPKQFMSGQKELKRPKFFPIVSSHILAKKLNELDGVDGFVVEGPTAGGHNAPARGKQFNENGEPIYGDKDVPDLTVMAALGKPFYLAGGYASPEKLQEAKQNGAAGIQVGSMFALCDESGLRGDVKEEVGKRIVAGNLDVDTSAVASPSGFPFQVVQLEGTLSDAVVFNSRKRLCNAGYLGHVFFRSEDGVIGVRCPAEPIDNFVQKGGKKDDAEKRVCLCNGLLATAGFPQKKGEPPIVTLGKDLDTIRDLLISKGNSYTAEDVVRYLTSA